MTPAEVLPQRIAAKVRVDPSGCWLWTAHVLDSGYGQIRWAGKQCKAHRIVYEIVHGSIPEGPGYHGTCVCHRCDVRRCVNPQHLFLGSQAENVRDRDRKGRCAPQKGARNGNARLGADQVREIRALRGQERQADTAARHGITQSQVSLIQLRKSWSHVE